MEARRESTRLTLAFLRLGLEGSAGSTVSLDDEWEGASIVAPQDTLAGEKESSDYAKTASSSSSSQSDPASEEGLSLFVKLALAGVIFAGCFAWVKVRSSSRPAGKHGAYEKVGV